MSATRDDVVAAARTWLGTPFHDCADLKGAGVDCAMLLVRVYCDLGLVPMIDPRPYKPQWFQHQAQPIFIEWLERVGARRTETPERGDVVVMSFGKHEAHGAIVVDDLAIIHAYMPAGAVVYDDRRGLGHRVKSAWTVFS
jgi:cell wall-associated NlpC family hydrolase